MLKKFLNGLMFGLGFAIALIVILAAGVHFILPNLVTSYTTQNKEPKFENPSTAVVREPDPESSPELEKKDFSFFKESGSRMPIPAGGGLLAMSPTTTPKGSKRPSTYQLWLTESKLWQIRTTEEKVEIEELPYPRGASVKSLYELMHKSLGLASLQSTMTVSSEEITHMKSTGTASLDGTLNGKLKISVEGVVFVLPNPY